MIILNRIINKIIIAILVFIIFSGCSSSSSSQRFGQNKNGSSVNPKPRFENSDTTKRYSNTKPKNKRIVFNDLPADTSDEFDE
ncbi:MAG: hypothetical protein AABZ54_02640, partial [Bacteroidota bacterium]